MEGNWIKLIIKPVFERSFKEALVRTCQKAGEEDDVMGKQERHISKESSKVWSKLDTG